MLRKETFKPLLKISKKNIYNDSTCKANVYFGFPHTYVSFGYNKK